MYTPEQASQIRQRFWTSFGKYMAPVLSSENEKVNWINYKTGIPNVNFRMDASKTSAYIGIEILNKNNVEASKIYNQFCLLKPSLEEIVSEQWLWEKMFENESGQRLSRISTTLSGCNVMDENSWPLIISFLKPRMIALDKFWNEYKMIFEMAV